MLVFQTAGAPPSRGVTIFVMMGWTEKSRKALTKIADAKRVRIKETCVIIFFSIR
jgi:hypothetical protein